MNELQKTEFEILKIFTEICGKLGLKYYLVCGSALGAVKYGGFIPWDDDIDAAMPRPDYEAFLSEAPKLLPDYIFLQNHRTDPQYANYYSKLRDSRTTYIESSAAHRKINHGIFIDIFPLDGYPTDEKEIKRLEFYKKLYTFQLSCAYRIKRSFRGKIACAVGRLMGYHNRTAEIVGKAERLLSKYPSGTSLLWCNHGNSLSELEYAPREQYGDGALMKFEGLEVRVPERYDEYLTRKYGNWRDDIPAEQQVGHHYCTVSDPSKPYTEYTK